MICSKHTTRSLFSAFSWGRMSLAFLNLPVWFCSVNCYEPLLKQVRALPSLLFCTLLQLQSQLLGWGDGVSQQRRLLVFSMLRSCWEHCLFLQCSHCCVRFRPSRFSWSCCTFGKSGEQGLPWKNFCFVQCVCHNQELNWTVPTWGRSEGDHSFWSLVQNYSTGLGWHSVHGMFWLVAPFMDVCCNLILDRFSPLNL